MPPATLTPMSCHHTMLPLSPHSAIFMFDTLVIMSTDIQRIEAHATLKLPWCQWNSNTADFQCFSGEMKAFYNFWLHLHSTNITERGTEITGGWRWMKKSEHQALHFTVEMQLCFHRGLPGTVMCSVLQPATARWMQPGPSLWGQVFHTWRGSEQASGQRSQAWGPTCLSCKGPGQVASHLRIYN